MTAMLRKLSELQTCNRCRQNLNEQDPRCLPCLHAFCRQCLEKMVREETDTLLFDQCIIRCPTCHKQAKIAGRNVAALPHFFHIHSIKALMSDLLGELNTCKICVTRTLKSQVVSYCFQCQMAMCESCKQRHHSTFNDHAHLPISSSTIRYLLCEEHEKHVYAFCIDCGKAVCTHCAVHKHWNHNIYHLTDHLDGELERLREDLNTKEQTIDSLLMKLDNFRTEFKEGMQNTKETLDSHHRNLMQKLETQYQSLCSQLQEHSDRVTEELVIYRQSFEDAKKSICELRIESDKWKSPLKEVPGAEFAAIENIVSDMKSKIPDFDTSIDTSIDRLTDVKFIPEQREPSLGLITEVSSFDDEADEDEEDLSFETNSREEVGQPFVMWRLEEGGCVTDIAPFPNGNLLVALDNYGLIVYDKNGTQVEHSLSRRRIGNITGISVGREGKTVAVVQTRPASPGSLQVYTANKNKWRKLEYEICSQPNCVAVTSNGEILVSSSLPILLKYDLKGCNVWKRSTASAVRGICVDKDDRLIVCSENDITVFDLDGKIMNSVISKADECFGGVCLTPNCNILVTDSKNNIIMEFDQYGKYIKEILKVNGNVDRIGIFGNSFLAVIRENNLFVYRF